MVPSTPVNREEYRMNGICLGGTAKRSAEMDRIYGIVMSGLTAKAELVFLAGT